MKDNTAVSPVIGTVIIVFIVIFFAAVIGTFVLGLQNEKVNEKNLAEDLSFEAYFVDCSDGKVRATLTELEFEKVPNFETNNLRVDIFKDGERIGVMNNSGSSRLLEVAGNGTITLVPTYEREKEDIIINGSRIEYDYLC